MRRCRRKSGYIHKNIRRIVLIALIVITGSMILRTGGNFFKLSGNFLTGRNRADTSLGWNLILVNSDYAIPDNYELELTELSNGEKVDSRIYPDIQKMFDDARLSGLHLFVREGYRTWEEQQAIMDERIEEYREEGYSKQEAKQLAEEYVADPGTSEHQLGIAVDINADTSGSSSDAVYAWLDENAYKLNVFQTRSRMDIEQAIDHLPEELREITILFFFQGLKQKDIAELQNIKLSLVKYRISRAKKLLSEYLEVRE